MLFTKRFSVDKSLLQSMDIRGLGTASNRAGTHEIEASFKGATDKNSAGLDRMVHTDIPLKG